jgi:organic hydroperoxide reductase OsmC/OhrA
MKAYPHEYQVNATAQAEGEVLLDSPGLDTMHSAPPVEFDGPGDRWSPETLLVAAIADCFILTFRAIARATRMEWQGLECQVTGTLTREQGKARFTEFHIGAKLSIPLGTDVEQARAALEKAEHGCLISNSLNGEIKLETEVIVVG